MLKDGYITICIDSTLSSSPVTAATSLLQGLRAGKSALRHRIIAAPSSELIRLSPVTHHLLQVVLLLSLLYSGVVLRILVRYTDRELMLIWISYQSLSSLFYVEIDSFSENFIVLLFLQRGTMQLDIVHCFLFRQFFTVTVLADERDLVSIVLHGLIQENFKSLLVCELADVIRVGSRFGIFKRPHLLLVNLPEPLVDLVLFQVQLFCKLNSHLAVRNTALVPLVELVEDVTLISVFAVAIFVQIMMPICVEEIVFGLLVDWKRGIVHIEKMVG